MNQPAQNDSSLNLKVGNKELSILESLEDSQFNIKKYSEKDEWDQEDNENKHARRSRFRGHWSGIEFGFNNYLLSDKSYSMSPDIDYMTLNSSKSSNFNINF
jgi:hypothetical protein